MVNSQKWEILPLIGSPRLDPHLIKLNALGSLYYFAKFVLQRGRLTEHLHKPICENLERQRLNYLLELPRDHFKTTMMTEALPIWWSLPFTDNDEAAMRELGYSDEWIRWMRFAHDPLIRILIVSEAALNAEKLGMRIDQHFYNNGRFRDLFPEIIPNEKSTWNASSKCVGGSKFRPHGEGTFDFIGVGGALQSRHYDRMIEDDLVGKDALRSEIVMNDTIEYHKLLEGAFDGPDHTELVVGNRWSPWDLNGWIRDNEPEFVVESHSALGGCCPAHNPGSPILPEEFTIARLEKIRRRQGPYLFCVREDAPILMSDWSERRIDEIREGDEVVGYEFGRGKYGKLVRAKVLALCSQEQDIVKVTMESGREVYCTPNHKWFVSSHNHRGRTPYMPARVGKDLVSILNVSSPSCDVEQRDLDWLGGILDGEGTASHTVMVAQCPTVNPEVCKRLEYVCGRLKIPLHYTPDSKSWALSGGRSLKVRLLRHAAMAKWQRFSDRLWDNPSRIPESSGRISAYKGFDPVVSIEPAGRRRVFGMETTSGNYVAWGFASQNSHQYLNQAVIPDEIVFKPEWLRFYKPKPDSFMQKVVQDGVIKEIPANRMLLEHEVVAGTTHKDILVNNLVRSMVVDPNHAGSEGRARHCILITGLDPDTDRIYLLDLWAQSMPYDDLMANVYRLADRWRMTEFYLETVAAQKYLKYHIEYRNKVEKRTLRCRELKTDRGKNAKWTRIDALSPLFEQGKIYVRRDQSAFLDEYYRYTHSMKHTVDILDCMGYAPQTWSTLRVREIAAMKEERKARMGRRSNATGY